MRSFLAMVKANLKMTLRNRSALFWNLVFPALFIVIFGVVLGGDPDPDISLGLAGDEGAFRQELTEVFESDDIFSVHSGIEADELVALEDGDRDVVLVFGEQTGSELPAITQYFDNSQGPDARVSTTVVNQYVLTVAQGENPVQLESIGIAGPVFDFIDFFVPGILAMAIMNAGVIGLSTSFVSYRERGILRRIRVTPLPLPQFVSARIVSQLVVAVAQALILVGVAQLLFDLDVKGNPMVILLAIFAGSIAFLSIGFALSSIAPNVETAASYANLITFPMLFLSGVFFDSDAGPDWVQTVGKFLPLTYLVDALREPMTHGKGLTTIWPDLVVLGLTFLIGMVVAVRFFRWEARHG